MLLDDQRAIQDAARGFAEAGLAPHSACWDETKHFPIDVLKAAALGFGNFAALPASEAGTPLKEFA